MKNIIVAYDEKFAIGKNGGLLWKFGEMRADMAHFKSLTMGSAVIMGRKTLDSIGMALPGRQNIVLCQSGEAIQIPDVEIAHSFNDAYSLVKDNKEIFVIGGGEVYKQALKDVDRIYATEVNAVVEDADTFFPPIDDNWQKIDDQNFPADEDNKYSYNFVTYDRK